MGYARKLKYINCKTKVFQIQFRFCVVLQARRYNFNSFILVAYSVTRMPLDINMITISHFVLRPLNIHVGMFVPDFQGQHLMKNLANTYNIGTTVFPRN